MRRIGPAIAEWVASVGRDIVAAELELVDLKDWPLPLDEEPAIPATGIYHSERTRAWSRKIATAAGFVFVTPQYNWGYPASLKNALDHLYGEWAGKPAMIVSYGGHGGDKCAAQLRQVLEALKMRPVETMPALTLTRAAIEADTGEIDPATAFSTDYQLLRRGFADLARTLAG